MKQSKKHYYCGYFENYIKNMKSTWTRIKSIVFLNVSESESPNKTVNSKVEYLTNPIDIANILNNPFCSVAPNIQSTIKQNFKHFQHYLTNPCVD